MFRRFYLAAALAVGGLVCACSGQDSTSPAPLGIIGQWNQGARLEDTANQQTHIHTGCFSFEKKGAGFSGTGQQSGLCSSAEHGDYTGPLANGIPFAIRDGVQSGDAVSFRSDLRTYEGHSLGDGEHIDGTARCTYSEGGVDFVWTGECWQTGSVEIPRDSQSVPLARTGPALDHSGSPSPSSGGEVPTLQRIPEGCHLRAAWHEEPRHHIEGAVLER